jgi:hypothetical protein
MRKSAVLVAVLSCFVTQVSLSAQDKISGAMVFGEPA